MKIAVLAVTENGLIIADRMKTRFDDELEIFAPPAMGRDNPWLLDLVSEIFLDYDGLVFISAVGIAVRAVAPHLRDKTVDPAIVVVDEAGAFSVSLVSGHIGGANDLAIKVADAVGAVPVITTATDTHGKPALDLFMKELGLKTDDMTRLTRVSSGILRGESACIFADIGLGRWGDRVRAVYSVRPLDQLKRYGSAYEHVVIVVDEEVPQVRPGTLILKIRRVYAGIGSRKGVTLDEVRDAIRSALGSQGLHLHNLKGIASIDIKNEEKAFYEAAEHFGVEVQLYPADKLDAVAVNRSDFVKEKVGADGVCEPAAILVSEGGTLILPKTVHGKVTVALAEQG